MVYSPFISHLVHFLLFTSLLPIFPSSLSGSAFCALITSNFWLLQAIHREQIIVSYQKRKKKSQCEKLNAKVKCLDIYSTKTIVFFIICTEFIWNKKSLKSFRACCFVWNFHWIENGAANERDREREGEESTEIAAKAAIDVLDINAHLFWWNERAHIVLFHWIVMNRVLIPLKFNLIEIERSESNTKMQRIKRYQMIIGSPKWKWCCAYVACCIKRVCAFHASLHSQTDILLSIISDIIYYMKYYFICSFFFSSHTLCFSFYFPVSISIHEQAAPWQWFLFFSTSSHCVLLI